MPDSRRQLPSVERVLAAMKPEGVDSSEHKTLVAAARQALAEFRSNGAPRPAPTLESVTERAAEILAASALPSLRRVINATGVVLQTNLGRAPLSERAIAAIHDAAQGYSNLEFDIASGTRGSRHDHVRALIRSTTGAEDGIVVNNNAAALFMVLHVFAAGHDVLVSRGQAVEIGGGFRIPDVLRESGASLVEVGTTNRTYASDYERAWSERAAAILRVHASNFKIVGFTTTPPLQELAATAHTRGGLLIDDLGSGCLVHTEEFGLGHEPTVQESVRAGADLALFSGDKLLGGPQCGIIAGRSDLIATLRGHPLARALRVDKLSIAALNATLQIYADGHYRQEIPVWRMLAADPAALRRRAQRWARSAGPGASVVASRSMVGGGSLPDEGVPTWCAVLKGDTAAAALRAGVPAIVGRISQGNVFLDPRTVDPGDDGLVAARVRALAQA